MVKSRAWRPCARTMTAVPPPTPSVSSASAGHCWSCASCCWAPSVSPTYGRAYPRRASTYYTQRLCELPSPAASKVYELTNWGMELEPVVISLGRWGACSSSKPCDAELGIDSRILSFRTMFDPRAAEGLERATSCGSARIASAP